MPALAEDVVVEILDEQFWQDLEVLFIVSVNILYEIVDLINVLQGELILVGQSHNREHFLFEDSFNTDGLFFRT